MIVLTNQSAIGRGLVSRQTVDDMHRRLAATIDAHGGHVRAFLVCPHTPTDGCDCRKPEPGLLRRAHEEYQVDLKQAILVGDSVRDVQTAATVGMPAIMVLSGLGQISDLRSEPLPCRLALDLADAARLILSGKVLPPVEEALDVFHFL